MLFYLTKNQTHNFIVETRNEKGDVQHAEIIDSLDALMDYCRSNSLIIFAQKLPYNEPGNAYFHGINENQS